MEQNGTQKPESSLAQPEREPRHPLLGYGLRGLSQQLSQRQLSALPHLLRPGTLRAKAKTIGVGRTTLYRWLEDENFRVALQVLREATLHVAQSELQAMSYEAAEVLYRTLHSEDPDLSYRAARTVLDQANEAHYGQRMEERVDALREASDLSKHTAPPW